MHIHCMQPVDLQLLKWIVFSVSALDVSQISKLEGDGPHLVVVELSGGNDEDTFRAHGESIKCVHYNCIIILLSYL